MTSSETAMPKWLVIISGRRPTLSLQLDAMIDPVVAHNATGLMGTASISHQHP